MTPHDAPFDLLGFDHVVFYVDGLDKALAFYSEVLGCVPGYSYPDIGMEQLWCGASLIVLWDLNHPACASERPIGPKGRNVDHLCIATGPIDADRLRAHMARHGVEIVDEAFHGGARGMGHAFYVLDPFGNKIELKGPSVYPDGKLG
jgi:glyoxylase I family protein